jgi:hypothetical protein
MCLGASLLFRWNDRSAASAPTLLPLRRRGSYVHTAPALVASRLEAEAANHAGDVLELTWGSLAVEAILPIAAGR